MVMKMWLGFTERLKLFMYALHVWFVLYWKHLLQHWLRAVRQTALIIDLWQVMAGPMCWVFLKLIRLCSYFCGSNSIFILFFSFPPPECSACWSGKYPFTWHASCTFQHPYTRHSPSWGPATFYPQEDISLWVRGKGCLEGKGEQEHFFVRRELGLEAEVILSSRNWKFCESESVCWFFLVCLF